jgi:hypothetical protein
MADLRRAVAPGRLTKLAGTAAAYIAARRQDPFGVVNLFKPGTWPRRIRLIADGVKQKW